MREAPDDRGIAATVQNSLLIAVGRRTPITRIVVQLNAIRSWRSEITKLGKKIPVYAFDVAVLLNKYARTSKARGWERTGVRQD
jgi:hypothetical protein